MIDFYKRRVERTCPKCQGKYVFELGQIAKEDIVTCNNCSVEIQLIDTNGSAKQQLQKVTQKFNELEKTLKNFGKRR